MNDVLTIMEGEQAIAAAHLSLDVSTLDWLYHADFVIAQPDGSFETKQQVLASFSCGERHWESAKVEDLRVLANGSTGVVFGTWTAVGTNRGTSFDYAAQFLSVWTKENGVWRNLAYHAVDVKHV